VCSALAQRSQISPRITLTRKPLPLSTKKSAL